MRILHIITTLDRGGAEKMLQSLLTNNIDNSEKIFVISLKDKGSIGENLEKIGIKTYALEISSIFMIPFKFIKLFKLIVKIKPDLIQTWLYHANILGSLTSSIYGNIPVVWNLRGCSIPQGKTSLTFWLVKFSAWASHLFPKKIICCANSVKEAHIKMGYKKDILEVIPNGFNFMIKKDYSNKRLANRKSLGIKESEILIGSVCRFDDLKDINNFIKAAAILIKKTNKSIRFIIIGRDINNLNLKLLSWLKSSDMQDKIILADEQNDLEKFYCSMDIFCLHSLSEGFPNVLAEAMSFKLPCVSTNAGDASLILEDKKYIVDIKNSESLAKSLLIMTKLSIDERKKIGYANALKIKEKYNLAKIAKMYESVYLGVSKLSKNIDKNTVAGFGDEWTRFDQTGMSEQDSINFFNSYFSIFPWENISKNSIGFDLGCGSGRWAKHVAPRVKELHCIDPSVAIDIARKNLQEHENCIFHKKDVDEMPLDDNSMDFGYSLGVLHHIPDTKLALKQCVRKIKPGSPMLIYLYYALENKPLWYSFLWRLSEFIRGFISKMPHGIRFILSQIMAIFVYWPLARLAKIAEIIGINSQNFPLSFYKNAKFYVMRTDALDRFGTQLEQRFTKKEIEMMMQESGLVNISFSKDEPYWCVVGFKDTNLIGE